MLQQLKNLENLLYEKDNIYVLDFYEVPQALKKKIDDKLQSLIDPRGKQKKSLSQVKFQFLVFFNNNTDPSHTKNIGYMSEFLAHLFVLDENGIDREQVSLEQASLLQNLEEPKSPKKGFDGVYFEKKSNEIWVMESKAALRTTNTTHTNKISKAYNSLKKMLKEGNSPWLNAYNHAFRVDDSLPILDQLTELDKAFNRGDPIPIEECNIIPVGTLFLSQEEPPYTPEEKEAISASINKSKLPSKSCISIAITCRVYEVIIEYIKEGAENATK